MYKFVKGWHQFPKDTLLTDKELVDALIKRMLDRGIVEYQPDPKPTTGGKKTTK